jgi:hypothetical protein
MGLPSQYHFEQKHFVPTSCLAVRRSVVERVGAFDPDATSGGDKEFGGRVHRDPELTTTFRDDIVVYHPARTTFAAHRKKALRVGRGLARLADLSGAEGRSVLRELMLHAVPPDPRRIVRRAEGHSVSEILALYAADLIIRWLRLYGALTSLLR